MSSRPRTTGLAAIVLSALAATSAAPQTGRPSEVRTREPAGAHRLQPPPAADSSLEARLLARLDTLRERVQETRGRSRREREPGAVALDTFMVGGVRVITPVEDAATVAPWIREAVASVEARVGTIPTVTRPPTLEVDWRPITTSFDHGAGQLRLLGQSATTVRRSVENGLAQVLTRTLPAAVQEWGGCPFCTPAAAHDELGASPVWPVPVCREGDLDACAIALGIDPVDAPALSPDQRAELDALLRSDLPPQALPGGRYTFVSPDLRRSFLHHLLRTRPDALTRLMTMEPDGDDLRALLERAAGTSLEPILAGWREAVLADRSNRRTTETATTVVWVLLLLGLATRSTRWRAA